MTNLDTSYTVKQLANLAGVSPRTLHYYDEIGLLTPGRNPENGYRLYDRPALLRLQQILFLRELGLSLEDIRQVLDRPDFDLLTALEQHRRELAARQARLTRLIATVERTILFLKGNAPMKSKELFSGFSEEEEKEYTERARQRYGDNPNMRESQRRWGSYSEEKKQQIMEEGKTVYTSLIEAIPHGPESTQAQEGIARWHQHLRYFYEPTTEVLLGLGDLYNEDPEFSANFEQMHPDLAAFMRRAIRYYCQKL